MIGPQYCGESGTNCSETRDNSVLDNRIILSLTYKEGSIELIFYVNNH